MPEPDATDRLAIQQALADLRSLAKIAAAIADKANEDRAYLVEAFNAAAERRQPAAQREALSSFVRRVIEPLAEVRHG